MWDQTTDRMLLELRDDAVLVFEQRSMQLLCLNEAAQALFPDAEEGTEAGALFQNDDIDTLLANARSSGNLTMQMLPQVPWFAEPAVLHALCYPWDGKDAMILTIDRRAYGPPPEALQMMKAVLTSAYFTAIRVDLDQMNASVISDKNPLMNTQARFSSYSDFIAKYAAAVIHPEDRAQFLAAFTPEQLHLFMEANTSPAVTVRRQTEEEYRWASFTLAAVNANVVLLFGKDSNEQHLQQERSDRYRSELAAVSQRNDYIISSISDIFRLMLHIDLRTGDTVLCAIHDDLREYFSFDKVYQFNEIANALIKLVHPDDRIRLASYSTLDQLNRIAEEPDHRLSFEYRRVAPQQDPNINPKWTRSVITLTKYDDTGAPCEAVYAVQDIHVQKEKELRAQQAKDSLTAQFHALIRSRFIWFMDCDYSKQVCKCYRIANKLIMPAMECPFGQFFERVIMPHCHPEDYKKVAMALLPDTAAEAFRQGKEQLSVDYRNRSEDGWRYVRAELYLQQNKEGDLHGLLYIADIDDEVQSRNELTRTEHEQLILRRKFGLMIEDSFLRFGEIDLDSDTISHYQIKDRDYVSVRENVPFSEYVKQFPERHIHPEQRGEFEKHFSYEQILRAARSHQVQIKRLFLVDPDENHRYIWCNIAIRFFRDENGKAYLMTYIEDVNEEIRNRDIQLHELKEARDRLRSNIREREQARIRKAHVFLNIASNFQLALNQIYATLDRMEHTMPEQIPEQREMRRDFRSMFTAYERLSAMTECAKDVLLLENNQLPILQEPVNLPQLFRKLKQDTAQTFGEKQIRLTTYTSHVNDETILCDAERLTYIFDNIFVNVIRSLPVGSAVTLQLAESAIAGSTKQAMYEFSLITHGDSVSQDIQSSILEPIPETDPLRTLGETMMMHQAGYERQNLYLSKRIISLLHGTLSFVKLPNKASAVTLRIPFPIIPNEIIFPLSITFGKLAFVWDSNQVTAAATMEMLRETGMRLHWLPDLSSLKANLKLCTAEGKHCDLLVLRQSDLNAQEGACLDQITALSPDTPILIIADRPAKYDETVKAGYLRTPLFRSGLAEQMQRLFRPAEEE